MPAKLLFHRDYRQFQGGHLKVWDYFQHARHANGYEAQIYFTQQSVWDENNPWFHLRSQGLPHFDPEHADVLFVAGHDWLALPPPLRSAPARPVINLVQHVRHADPGNPLYAYLKHPAIRICVSGAVADAIIRTGRCVGPVVTIPNGVDITGVTGNASARRDIAMLIVAGKRPDLGRALAARLSDLPGTRLLDGFVPRADFLHLLRRSQIAVLLPDPTEGFYLPALEAMLLGAVVVCPDAVGNRSFCVDGETCLSPDFGIEALEAAARHALALSDAERARLTRLASERARVHDLATERAAFHAVLASLPDLWRSASSGEIAMSSASMSQRRVLQ